MSDSCQVVQAGTITGFAECKEDHEMRVTNSGFIYLITQDSILIYECLLSAFDLSLKCNFVRQIMSSYDLSDTSCVVELPGRTLNQDNETNTARTDLAA